MAIVILLGLLTVALLVALVLGLHRYQLSVVQSNADKHDPLPPLDNVTLDPDLPGFNLEEDLLATDSMSHPVGSRRDTRAIPAASSSGGVYEYDEEDTRLTTPWQSFPAEDEPAEHADPGNVSAPNSTQHGAGTLAARRPDHTDGMQVPGNDPVLASSPAPNLVTTHAQSATAIAATPARTESSLPLGERSGDPADPDPAEQSRSDLAGEPIRPLPIEDPDTLIERRPGNGSADTPSPAQSAHPTELQNYHAGQAQPSQESRQVPADQDSVTVSEAATRPSPLDLYPDADTKTEYHEDGENWQGQVAELKKQDSLDEALLVCQQEFPLWSAYQQASLIHRARIKQLVQDGMPLDGELEALYRLAAQASFLHDRVKGLPNLPLSQLKKVDLDEVAGLDMPYEKIGYNELRLIKKSDIKLLLENWGKPQTHIKPRELHADTWKSLIARRQTTLF